MKRLYIFFLFCIFGVILSVIETKGQWQIPTIIPTANTVDSTKIKDGSVSNADIRTDLTTKWTAAHTRVAADSANWNTGYVGRLQWDGGNTNLVAATGRTSLELGALATLATVDSATATDNGLAIGDVAALSTRLSEKLPLTSVDDSLSNYGISRGTKKTLQVRGAVGVDDTLQAWRSSLGSTKAWLDSLGNARVSFIRVLGGATATSLAANSIEYHNTGILVNGGASRGLFDLYVANSNGSSGMSIFNSDVNGNFLVNGGGNVGVGTASPIANSLTLGGGATQRDLIVTRENTPAASDSSFKVTITNGYPVLSFYGGDGGLSTITNEAGGTIKISGKKINVSEADADTTLTIGLSSSFFSNYGATAKKNYTLPAAVVGVNYEFLCADTDSLRILPTGDTIKDGATTTSTGYVSGVSYSTCRIIATTDSTWVITNKNGTWASY